MTPPSAAGGEGMAGDYCEPWCVVWLDESGFGLRAALGEEIK